MEYVLVIHRAEGGGYRAEVPALKGCFVQAGSLDAVLADAPRIISSHLEALTELGLNAPTAQGIIIATVTTPEPPAGVREGHQARVLLNGEGDKSPTPSLARAPGLGDVLGGKTTVESEIAPEVSRTFRERLTETARIFGVVLTLWVLAIAGWVLWNAWDARDGALDARGSGAAGAAQTAPTVVPSATAVQPYATAVVAPVVVALAVTPTAALPATARSAQGGYVVEPGETLWDISQKFGLTVEDIMKANDLTDRSFVMAGQRLVIPEARR